MVFVWRESPLFSRTRRNRKSRRESSFAKAREDRPSGDPTPNGRIPPNHVANGTSRTSSIASSTASPALVAENRNRLALAPFAGMSSCSE